MVDARSIMLDEPTDPEEGQIAIIDGLIKEFKDGEWKTGVLNSSEIEQMVAQVGIPYFPTKQDVEYEGAPVENYYLSLLTPSEEPEQEISKELESEDEGVDFELAKWIPDPFEPRLSTLRSGIYSACGEFQRTYGNRNFRYSFSMIEVDPSDGSIVWESEKSFLSDTITDNRQRFTTTLELLEPHIREDDSHVFGLRLYVQLVDSGTAEVTLYVEGDNRCNLKLPSSIGILAEVFASTPHGNEHHDPNFVQDGNPEDLSDVEGEYDGQMRFNDGTAEYRGYFWWDEGESEWVSISNPEDTISPT